MQDTAAGAAAIAASAIAASAIAAALQCYDDNEWTAKGMFGCYQYFVLRL